MMTDIYTRGSKNVNECIYEGESVRAIRKCLSSSGYLQKGQQWHARGWDLGNNSRRAYMTCSTKNPSVFGMDNQVSSVPFDH